jgi:DNA polymerase III subunit chi
MRGGDARRVDFYVLDAERDETPLQFACRLSERALRDGYRVLIACPDAPTLATLDGLLWSFRPDAFVPHGQLHEGVDADTADPVILALATSAPTVRYDLLIHLDAAPPPHGLPSGRVADIVGPDPQARSAGRERYRWYRAHGVEPTTHTLT